VDDSRVYCWESVTLQQGFFSTWANTDWDDARYTLDFGSGSVGSDVPCCDRFAGNCEQGIVMKGTTENCAEDGLLLFSWVPTPSPTPPTLPPTEVGQCPLLYPEATSVLYDYVRDLTSGDGDGFDLGMDSGEYCVQAVDLEADNWGFSEEYAPASGHNIASNPHDPSNATCQERYGNPDGAVSTQWSWFFSSDGTNVWTHNVEDPAFATSTAFEVGCTNHGREVQFMMMFDGDRNICNLRPVSR
jgi:hypothetical protein